MNHYAPIALFVYNRLRHTQETVRSLLANKYAPESDLFVYSDAPKLEEQRKSVEEVRGFIKTVEGFKSVTLIERESNLGLAKSIISGVTEVVERHDKIIVVEDDMLLSEYFLQYMNEALELYKNEERVISIHGYCYPVNKPLPETFFLLGADCWGWATWKRGWKLFEPDAEFLLKELITKRLAYKFDLNGSTGNIKMLKNQISGRVDSWAIRWNASAFLKNKLTLYPGISLVKNIGTDGGGTHSKNTEVFDTLVSNKPVDLKKIPAEENFYAENIFEKYFISIKPNHIKIMLKKMLKNNYYQIFSCF